MEFLATLPLILSLTNRIAIYEYLQKNYLVKIWWKYMPSDYQTKYSEYIFFFQLAALTNDIWQKCDLR